MKIQQLRLFNDKCDFNPQDIESDEYKELFSKITGSIYEAFDALCNMDITFFDSTTRASMLNNYVVEFINRNCDDHRFALHKSLSNTRRSCASVNDKYILFFKKHPVSNLQTKQDELIKYQMLDKHVIFIAYYVDMFWNSISKIELQYFTSPDTISYTYDLTRLITPSTNVIRIKSEENILPNRQVEGKPKVSIKKDLVRKKAE